MASLHRDIFENLKIFFAEYLKMWASAKKLDFCLVCIFGMLNTILIECVTPYRLKHHVQHLIKIILDISKIYTPATSAMTLNDDRKTQLLVRDFSRAVYHRVGQTLWSQ